MRAVQAWAAEPAPRHSRLTVRLRPLPSAPTTRQTARRMSTASMAQGPSMSRPTRSTPRSRILSSALVSEATRHSVACSIPPAEARNMAGVRGADRCSGQTTAVAPMATDERTTAPKFCGSLNFIESDDQRRRSHRKVIERHERKFGSERDCTLVPHATRHAVELCPSHAFHPDALIARVSCKRLNLWQSATRLGLHDQSFELAPVGTNGLSNGL